MKVSTKDLESLYLDATDVYQFEVENKAKDNDAFKMQDARQEWKTGEYEISKEVLEKLYRRQSRWGYENKNIEALLK